MIISYRTMYKIMIKKEHGHETNTSLSTLVVSHAHQLQLSRKGNELKDKPAQSYGNI